MLTAALCCGFNQGIGRAVLDVDGTNRPAIRLYEGLGFRFVTGSLMMGRGVMVLDRG